MTRKADWTCPTLSMLTTVSSSLTPGSAGGNSQRSSTETSGEHDHGKERNEGREREGRRKGRERKEKGNHGSSLNQIYGFFVFPSQCRSLPQQQLQWRRLVLHQQGCKDSHGQSLFHQKPFHLALNSPPAHLLLFRVSKGPCEAWLWPTGGLLLRTGQSSRRYRGDRRSAVRSGPLVH